MFRGRAVGDGAAWTDDDRSWALALADYEASIHRCGQPIAESFDSENDGRYAVDPLICWSCYVLDKESGADAETAGRQLTVHMIEGMPRDDD